MFRQDFLSFRLDIYSDIYFSVIISVIIRWELKLIIIQKHTFSLSTYGYNLKISRSLYVRDRWLSPRQKALFENLRFSRIYSSFTKA